MNRKKALSANPIAPTNTLSSSRIEELEKELDTAKKEIKRLEKYQQYKGTLFVEWKGDREHITSAWSYLRSTEMLFWINAWFDKEWNWAKNVCKYLLNYEDAKNDFCIGLFDFDNLWFNEFSFLEKEWNTRIEKQIFLIDGRTYELFFLQKNYKYAFLLPVFPEIRDQVINMGNIRNNSGFMGPDSTNSDPIYDKKMFFNGYPQLVIEHMYYGISDNVDSEYQEIHVYNWGRYYGVPDGKNTFLDRIIGKIGPNLNDQIQLFRNFEPLFLKIEEIILSLS